MMKTNLAIFLACLWLGHGTVRAQTPVEIEFMLIQAKEEQVLPSLIARRSNLDGGALYREFQYLLEASEATVVTRATLVARDGQEAALHAGGEIKFPIKWEASPKRDKVVPIEFRSAALGTVASVTPTINGGTVTLTMAFEHSEEEPRKWDTRLAKKSGNPPSEIDFVPTIHSEGLEKSVVSVVDGVWSAVHWTRARVNGSTPVTALSNQGKEETFEKPFGYTQVLFARAKAKDVAVDKEPETKASSPPPATVHLMVIGVNGKFVRSFLENGISDHDALLSEALALVSQEEAYFANYVGLTTDSGMEGRGGQRSTIDDAIQFDYLESVGRVVPRTTESRRVGVSFSSQPHVSPNASLIQMRLALDMVNAAKARAYPVPVLGKRVAEQARESYPEFFDRGIKATLNLKNGGTILAGFGPALSIDEPPWSRWKPGYGISFTLPTLLYFVTAYAGDANAVAPGALPDPNGAKLDRKQEAAKLRSIHESTPKNFLVQTVLCKPAKANLETRLLKDSLEPDVSLCADMLGSLDVCHGVTTASATKGEVWSHRKIIWPTNYRDAGSGIIAPVGPQTANVGARLRCEPQAGPTPADPSQRDIDLVFDFEQVTPTQMLRYPVDSSDSGMQVVFPQFHRTRVETRHSLRSRAPRLLSVLRADSRVVVSKAERDRMSLVFGQVQEFLAK